MTKDEAIDYIIPAIKNYWNDKICDNIIKALAQEPCKDAELEFVQPHKKIPVNLEICDDAISRQAAIDGLNSINGTSELDKAFEVIENLTPVQPKQETVSKESYDAISRKWIKEAIHNFYKGLNHIPTEEDIQRYIEVAPPVTPQPKTEVLDKIKAEIKEKFEGCDICEWFIDYDYEDNNISEYQFVGSIDTILDIIDKYRESEE